ncbi:TadE family type IV pilus minor pilin [Mycobacterium sp. 155]|uniref:TadE family type IV pilus minor pilin n=1 Tax=Mycobacterium sp. 155 TaxID=1157943 RepID=UPI0003815817|nr:TadE family type IV pilus minor pilin [Mycobacterium sp. 155]
MVVLSLCLAGLSAVSMQVRCVDAAREAVRLAARGDDRPAAEVAQRIAPRQAVVQLRREGALVVARVSVSAALPGLTVSAEAAAATEPGVR